MNVFEYNNERSRMRKTFQSAPNGVEQTDASGAVVDERGARVIIEEAFENVAPDVGFAPVNDTAVILSGALPVLCT